jgi:hypothetical protein
MHEPKYAVLQIKYFGFGLVVLVRIEALYLFSDCLLSDTWLNYPVGLA